MSGFTPVFDSIFQGSLCGKYPDLPVWLVLLAMQQRGGIVDAHPSYIAMVSGIPQADVEAAIRRFCEPDEQSRTPDNDGRRLEPLPDRGFGWRVLNHDIYREKARKKNYDDERTASGRDAERKQAERQSRAVPTSPDASRDLPLSEAEAETESDKNHPTGGKARKRAAPPRKRCPDDWQPPEPEVAKIRAECPDVDLAAASRKFRDHEFARGRSDWLACWRNWMREEQARSVTRPRPLQPVRRPPPTDAEIDAAKRKAAADNRRELARLGVAALQSVPR